jgi:hypothetical protein
MISSKKFFFFNAVLLSMAFTQVNAIEVRLITSDSSHRGSIQCAGDNTTLTNNSILAIRRGDDTLINLRESGLTRQFKSVSIDRCPGCQISSRDNGPDQVRLRVVLPANAPISADSLVTAKFQDRPDLKFRIAINPRYGIRTNLNTPIATVRQGDVLNLEGSELAAGDLSVTPSCVRVLERSNTGMKVKYECSSQPGGPAQTKIEVAITDKLPKDQSCVITQQWNIANFSTDAKPDLVVSFEPSANNQPFRPVSPGSIDVAPALCSNVERSRLVCERIFDSRFGTSTDGNCRNVPGSGTITLRPLSVTVKNVGTAPSVLSDVTAFNEQGAMISTKRLAPLQPGQSMPIIVREQSIATLIRNENISCQIATGNVVGNKFDPATFVVKIDANQSVDEGANGKSNNEVRF